MKLRKEFDSIGSIKVPNDKYWGTSTQRSKKYFDIGEFLVRPVLIKSIAIIKKAAAIVHGKEKQISLPTLIAIPFLFLLGAAVVYYVISPIAWKFFLSFQSAQAEGINITLQAKMNEYLSLMMTFIFAFGLAFQLPVILLLLVRFGVLSIQQLVSFRKYAIVLSFVFAAIITPPDPFSQISLALPVIILYEVSILISRFLAKKKKNEQTEEDLD